MTFLRRKPAHLRIEKPFARARRRKIPIGKSLVEDRLRRRPMKPEPLRLLILLIPAEVEPPKSFEDRIERSFGIAFDIGIVDAQNHGPAIPAGVQPIENECSSASDVQKARRRRRKPDSGHESPS